MSIERMRCPVFITILYNGSNNGNSLQTFPSGHAASSFAAAVFVTLYLNARLKVLSDQARDVWAFMVVLAPLTLASLVSASMYTSHVSVSALCVLTQKVLITNSNTMHTI